MIIFGWAAKDDLSMFKRMQRETKPQLAPVYFMTKLTQSQKDSGRYVKIQIRVEEKA